MRVAVVGAGGVGGLVGGMLARSGVPVAFVARGAQLAALRAGGLHVESPRGTFRIAPVEASDDPARLAPADVVLVAVKGWQVPELAARLAPLLAPGGFAVPLENGVEAASALARALGEERVVGGLCHVFAWVEAPGRVKHVGELLRVTMGELRPEARAAGASRRLEELAAALRAAQVDAVVADDIQQAMWLKFSFIAPFGGVGAVARAPIGAIRAVPESRALLASAVAEVVAVGRARGVNLPPDAEARTLAQLDGLAPGSTASMQRDLQAGRPSELEDQIGAVVRLAREAGVAVPTHAFLLAALLPQERAARQATTSRSG